MSPYLRLRLVTSQGPPYPSRSPRAIDVTDAPDRVVLHIQVVGLFQVLPVHETGAPINRRVTALVLRPHIGLDMARRVMLGRRRDGFNVVEDVLDRDVRDYAPFEVAPVRVS
jgi:hypothetical protein